MSGPVGNAATTAAAAARRVRGAPGAVRARLAGAAGVTDLDELEPRLDRLVDAVHETAGLAEGLERRVAELEGLLVPVLRARVDDQGPEPGTAAG